jgi:hypothetical protein
MKQTIGLSQFTDAFMSIRPNNLTYDGLVQLFDYFESYEADTGEEIELDVIAICCEYEELTIEEIIRQYNIEADDIEDDEIDDHVFNYLSENTSVIGRTDDTIVFQSF